MLSSAEVLFTNNSSNASSFAWDFGDGSSISDSISPVHEYNTAGMYLVNLIASDTLGCSASFSKIITVETDLSTGITANEDQTEMQIFQHDGDLQINIQGLNSSKMIIGVYNSAGQQVANYSSENSDSFSGSVQLNTSGMYIVHTLIGNKLQSKQISIIK
jgi:PKD repeat protein